MASKITSVSKREKVISLFPCLTISDIVERAGRLAGVHMALASKPCCISKVRVLGLKTLQYSTNSTTFGVATVRSFHPGFPGAAVPFCRNFERILETV